MIVLIIGLAYGMLLSTDLNGGKGIHVFISPTACVTVPTHCAWVKDTQDLRQKECTMIIREQPPHYMDVHMHPDAQSIWIVPIATLSNT